jgi:hypothetical protein
MLRRLETVLLVMFAASATGNVIGARAITGTCAPKDARSDRLISKFKAFVGKTDLGGTVEKTTVGLAKVTPSQVVLVTDNSVCTKAAVAFNATQLQKHTSYTLYVVTLGSSYGVVDTKMLQPGYEPAFVFDSAWKYIAVK